MADSASLSCEICILAGGRSARLGRDKSRLRLGRRTLLGEIRFRAGQLGLRVRITRRDLVPRCGPLGGIVTALRTTRADAVLFLSCDMPFVTTALLRQLLPRATTTTRTRFVHGGHGVGFPFVIPRDCLPVVERQVKAGEFSLQRLAAVLRGRRLRVSPRRAGQLFNINTPADWQIARARWARREKRSRSQLPLVNVRRRR